MHENLQQYLQEKHAPESLRLQLQKLDQETQAALSLLISELNPSANTLREYLRLAEETARRDQSSLVEIFENPEVERILTNVGCSRKEKQKQLRLLLERLRYPLVAEIRSRLEACRLAVRKDCGVVLTVPEDLEGEALTLNLSVRSSREMAEAAERLAAASEHPGVKEIFSILKGEL